jgi:hypothetical protein
MNILGIKLVTGEEVIADTIRLQDGRLSLKNAVQLRMTPPQIAGGQPGLGFTPFPTFSIQNESVMIEPIHVVYSYNPDESITHNCKQMFGSGIITPSKQIITG